MKNSGSFLRSRRGEVLTAGFVVLTVLLVILLGKLFFPFVRPLAWAAVLAIVVAPVFRWILRLTGQRRAVSALAVTGLVALAAIGPATFLGISASREAGKAYEVMRASAERGALRELLDRAMLLPRELLPGFVGEDTIRQAEAWATRFVPETAAAVSRRLAHAFNLAVGSLARGVLDLGVALLALFFFLRDGHAWLEWLKAVVPLTPAVRDTIISRIRDTTRAVVHGMVLTAAAQGILLGIGFAIFGIPLPVFFSLLGFIFALIPLVGPTALWLPAGLWLLYLGETPRAIGLMVWCGLLVSTLDNFLRPYLIGERARLPVLFLFLAILGGLLTFGALGLFLGPVVVSIAAAVGDVYRDASVARTRATKSR